MSWLVLWRNTGQNLEVTECPHTDISFQILSSLWNLARLHLSQSSTFRSGCQAACRAQIYLTYRGHLLCPCSPTSTHWLCVTQLHHRRHQLQWVSHLSENKRSSNPPPYDHHMCSVHPASTAEMCAAPLMHLHTRRSSRRQWRQGSAQGLCRLTRRRTLKTRQLERVLSLQSFVSNAVDFYYFDWLKPHVALLSRSDTEKRTFPHSWLVYGCRLRIVLQRWTFFFGDSCFFLFH